MDEQERLRVTNGRTAVDAYRLAHAELHSQPWVSDVPSKHTPLLEQMLKELNNQGFKWLDEFFTASDELNVEEAGLTGQMELTKEDAKVLDGMWH